MKTKEDLLKKIAVIDGKGYPAYKDLKGTYDYGVFQLFIEYIQSDPYAPPSRMYIRIGKKAAGIPEELMDSRDKRIAVSDFLTRAFGRSIYSRQNRNIVIISPGQEMVERTSVIINDQFLEVRFLVSMPAAGRRILGREAGKIFQHQLPAIVEEALLYKNLNQKALVRQVTLYLDQEYIRQQLIKEKLLAFVGNGAVLPRENGVTEKPMGNGAVPFQSPASLLIQMQLPSGRQIAGMGIPEGIILIVGGGYHGKSTLLHGLEMGVYNHIPDDGREYVITREDGVKIRAEDGRGVEKVDISLFINNLPGNKDTLRFSTENASGSTSQAANVIEGIEAGSRLLLIDEDTSATNFMIRDGRMQKLVAKEKEPITPFIDRVGDLYKENGISTILIAGGSGDYFQVADKVIMMDEYIPRDVTERAKEIARESSYDREAGDGSIYQGGTKRVPDKNSFVVKNGKDYFRGKGKTTLLYGKAAIDLSYLEQLTDEYQTNGIGAILGYLKEDSAFGTQSVEAMADAVMMKIKSQGLNAICPGQIPGNLAAPRKQELLAALNRFRGLKIKS